MEVMKLLVTVLIFQKYEEVIRCDSVDFLYDVKCLNDAKSTGKFAH